MDACTNPDILKVIYFFTLIVDIVKIIIPIVLIILGIVDFSKSVITSDEKVQKKTVSIFIKRIIYAVLIFAVPWIIEVLMVTLGDLIGGEKINFTDCIDNANSECIKALETEKIDDIEKKCDVDVEKIQETKEEEGKKEVCYYCESQKIYAWGTKASVVCPGKYKTKKECTINEPGAICERCETDSKWGSTEKCSGTWIEVNVTKEKCK